MTALDRFADSACRAIVGAGIEALDRGKHRLDTDFLLLGLAGTPDATATLRRHEVDPLAVRREIDRAVAGGHDAADSGDGQPRDGQPRDGETSDGELGDRELLATLGIDLDEVLRRGYGPTGLTRDDRRLWTLRRSPARPLRLTLRGPAGTLWLTGQSRKVVEVAAWAAGRGQPISAEHILWGLLADGTNESVRVLHRLGVDLRAVGREVMGERAAA